MGTSLPKRRLTTVLVVIVIVARLRFDNISDSLLVNPGDIIVDTQSSLDHITGGITGKPDLAILRGRTSRCRCLASSILFILQNPLSRD